MATELSMEFQQLISAFAKEMKTTLTENQVKQQIKIALLENNVHIDQAIEKSVEKVAAAVDRKTDAFVSQLTLSAKSSGRVQERVFAIETKLTGLWAKMLGIGAACTTLGATVMFFIGQINK